MNRQAAYLEQLGIVMQLNYRTEKCILHTGICRLTWTYSLSYSTLCLQSPPHTKGLMCSCAKFVVWKNSIVSDRRLERLWWEQKEMVFGFRGINPESGWMAMLRFLLKTCRVSVLVGRTMIGCLLGTLFWFGWKETRWWNSGSQYTVEVGHGECALPDAGMNAPRIPSWPLPHRSPPHTQKSRNCILKA